MKKQIFTILFLCVGALMSSVAQRIEVKELRLMKEAGNEAFHPKFTPDGKTILLSGEDYAGLKSFDLQTGKVRQLTTGAGAGWQPVISADSRTVVVRQTDFSANSLGVRQVYSINVENAQMQRLTAADIAGEVPLAAVLESKTSLTRQQAEVPVVYVNQDFQLVVEKNGRQTILMPNGAGAEYLYASLSPDGTKIAYLETNSGETFVCDLNGKVLANLGSNLLAPQWLGNDWVIGMDEKNDGYVVTDSNIVGVTANGKIRQNLTQLNSGKIAMYPTVSPDGNKIAFHTLAGELYIMEVIVK